VPSSIKLAAARVFLRLERHHASSCLAAIESDPIGGNEARQLLQPWDAPIPQISSGRLEVIKRHGEHENLLGLGPDPAYARVGGHFQ
jgi:hypothetical protein